MRAERKALRSAALWAGTGLLSAWPALAAAQSAGPGLPLLIGQAAGGTAYSVPVQTLYALWVQWCNARGAQAGWVGALRAQFSRRGYSVKRDQTRSDRATVVVGMRLSDEAQLLGVL